MSTGKFATPVRELLLDVAARLGSATEARWLLEQGLGTRNSAIAEARSGATATPDEVAAVEAMVKRRLDGEPLQYVLGKWDFRALELAVDSRVLIPRPETEVVVGHALDELVLVSEEAPAGEPMIVVDLGTGSGAVALSLALEGPNFTGGRDLQVWATDVDGATLELARENGRCVSELNQGISPVMFVQGNWFAALPDELRGRIALVVANPPYVSEAEWADLDPVVRDYEPRKALVSGPTGTEAIDEILNAAPEWLTPYGTLVVEIAPHQAEDSSLRAIVSGFDAVVVRRDFAERSRALVARRSGPFLELT
jgi:release factor glutamine methyltransferase